MSTRLDVITGGYLLATGKASPPSSGTKRDKLTAICNRLYKNIQVEPGIEWDWLYDVVGAGTVTATDIFDLDTDLNYISKDGSHELNTVRVLCEDGTTYVDYKTVHPRQLHRHRYENAVALITGAQLQFSRVFDADEQAFGGTIEVPGIIKLDDLTSDNDEIPPEMAQWLEVAIARDYVLTDSQRNYLYDDLSDQADDQLQGMKDRNGTGNDSASTEDDYFAREGNVGLVD